MATTGKPVSPAAPHTSESAEQLLLDLFDGKANALADSFEQWLTSSKAFLAFAQKNQSKIRKKIRMSRDLEESYNLGCELRTAFLLLQEPKFALAYEPYTMDQGRSADFAVTFRTNMTFHVEVTRLRISQQEQQLIQRQDASAESGLEEQSGLIWRYESRRLVDVVCDKFEQLSADTPNVLWVWSESRAMQDLEVGQLMVGLKRRVEQRDSELFSRYGFNKPADFIRYYQRLSVILVQNYQEPGTNHSPLWWQNNDARHPLPSKVGSLMRSLSSI